MGRPISNTSLLNFAWTLERHGVAIKYDLIGWNPLETEEELRTGIDFLKQFPKGIVSVVYQLKAFPGTPLDYILQNAKKSKPTLVDFERWAVLYQMALHSPYLEQLALGLIDSDVSSQDLDCAFRKGTERYDDGFRIFARRTLEPGELIRVTDIRVDRGEGEGLGRQDVEVILHRPIREQVTTGSILKVSHVFGSYEDPKGFWDAGIKDRK